MSNYYQNFQFWEIHVLKSLYFAHFSKSGGPYQSWIQQGPVDYLFFSSVDESVACGRQTHVCQIKAICLGVAYQDLNFKVGQAQTLQRPT